MHSRTVLLTLLGLFAISTGFVRAEDSVDGEIHDEGAATKSEDDDVIGASPDAEVSFLFTQPADANLNRELLSGKPTKFLIGFQNKGEKDFIIKQSEASFRYPMDFNYHIQNFTAHQYNRRVAPKEEVTLEYAFFAHESFAGRSLGLVVNLQYEDSEAHFYINNVFNETITILEDDTGFNTETGFLYLTFAGFGVLVLLGGQYVLNKLSHKAGVHSKRKPIVEQGTTSSEIDFEWIPKEHLSGNKKSPKPSSPRARKVKKAE